MVLSILLIFCLIVIIIGLATAKLNAKVPCDHNWVETEEGHVRCTKCYRMIRHTDEMSGSGLGVAQFANQDDTGRPARPEGIKISARVLKEADQVRAGDE